MNRILWGVATLFLAAAGVGLAGCQTGGEEDVSRTADGTLRVGRVAAADSVRRAVGPGGRTLVIDGFRGSVRLRATDATTARFLFVRHGRGDDAASAREAMRGVEITERGTAEEYAYELSSDAEARTRVDVRGQIPRSTALRLEQTSGPVTVSGPAGEVTVRHRHGSVEVIDARSSVDVAIENGDVTARFRTLPPEARVRLQTANGDLSLGLPPDASVQVNAETSVGDVRVRGLQFSPQRLIPTEAGARYAAQRAGGRAVVEMRTENGTVTLEAVDTTAAPTGPALPAADTTRPAAPVPTDTVPATGASPVPRDTAGPPADTAAAPADASPPDTAAPAEPTGAEADTTDM
jgi:hypothetical protein